MQVGERKLLMIEKPKLLVVDDDKRLRALLNRYLSDNGYDVESVSNVKEARAKLALHPYDLMALDVMMPGETGFEFTQSLRENLDSPLSIMPILLLTARGESEDRIKGLELGADDYLNKPFEPKELLLRIQKLLNRSALKRSTLTPEVKFGAFKYNTQQRTLYKGEEIIYLTSTESELLYILITNKGEALTRDDLAERSGITLSPRTIDVQITRLRRKIENDAKKPEFIKTVRHKGYIFAR